jgi:DNA-binding NtrC family response regulator
MPDRRVNGVSVLIVEDDSALREAIEDTLLLAGAEVIATVDGAAASICPASMATNCCGVYVNCIRRFRWC